ncbi:unnamed protein product [Echinostoma caproni]|uniref:Innexin n=1 Tax=Echinostoma caproni TaxID=27848 RepID=A0A183AW83_9TREM|nr:unnamed protein product [Echinostoma caproni]
MSLEGPSPSGIVTDPMCPVELTNPCGCNEPCVAVHTAAVATDVPFPCPHVSDHSSSDCQWSTEEHILQRLYEAEGSKLDAAFFYSGMHDAPVLRSPYFYESYEYGFPHSSMAHSPNVDRTFNRHHAKLSSDPTILLTLVRWARIGSSRLAGDDDAVDRLNYQFTTLIILLMITLTGLRQYLSHLPLQCWIPQEFSRSWEEYAEHYCWVTNTYFSDVQARLPPPEERKNVVRYYQWATFVLGLQAAGFFLPCLIWRLLQNYSGFQVKRIMQGVMQVNFATPSTVTRTVRGVAHYMDAIIYQRKYKFWQKLQMKAKVHTYGKASAELSKDSDPMFDPVKTVHFRTHSYDQANDSESTSVIAGSAQSRREGDGLTARKKGPAPSPPVKSSTPCAHSTQRDTIHPEPRSTLDSSGWCSICTCCVNASGLTNGGVDSIELKDTALKKKKKRSLTKKDPTGEERISLVN